MKTLLLLMLCLPLPLLAKSHGAPTPDAILNAKTVYIVNASGTQQIADGAYDALTKWARFQIVSKRSDADLILTFSATEVLIEGTTRPRVGMTVTTPSSDDPLYQITPGLHFSWAGVASDCIESFKKQIEKKH